ncbi:uncharacterized protein BCR38DRAFT_437640 [Pseudomassariella vexata]|uniref:Uncharacterized protein n=1 Tax=Pseudomassariella vexata TaxID=1141098 RepID=A0A1Y2DS99_9PEZI|nr:uncharacterized protein BCR38DRAFT_437640 [Pseudomassariella vexata]ORY62140.1 hypothetical protein BCR38DRAFT_437640 [Pseudomassariella vexata]
MKNQDVTQTLVESFNALADEVQNLSDRQTVLEHKLRYAHEQFQYFADRYAPGAAQEISETLVNLQLPPEAHNQSLANTNVVPLPRRKSSDSKHQIALIIREGRRAASSLTDFSKSSRSSRDTLSRTTLTTMSTILEQDFTVEGKKKGTLGCPFTRPASEAGDEQSGSQAKTPDPRPHQSSDPICAAMLEDTGSQQAPSANGTSKCPIRYMDQHSPEEIAHYLETHKHELPRSHEVCVRRYQKNEDHIRKLDAKYGNLVNMVEGLGRIHQPMLPEQDTQPQSSLEKGSHDRVETWAQTVSANATNDPDQAELIAEQRDEDDERQSHFDRPLKEVRVGESPSRPWGIPIPIYGSPSMNGEEHGRPESPPPAPVYMPSSTSRSGHPETPAKTGKCPFDHTKMQLNGSNPAMPKTEEKGSTRLGDARSNQPFTPATLAHHAPLPPGTTPGQPTFINAADVPRGKGTNPPAMLFTGPVFIGYPIEQAIQFMQQFQGQQ